MRDVNGYGWMHWPTKLYLIILLLVNDEVSQLKKNHKHIEDKLESFITTSKKDVESMKTSAKADLENLKKSSKADIDTAIRNLPKQDLSQYTMNSQFKTRYFIIILGVF